MRLKLCVNWGQAAVKLHPYLSVQIDFHFALAPLLFFFSNNARHTSNTWSTCGRNGAEWGSLWRRQLDNRVGFEETGSKTVFILPRKLKCIREG